MGSRIKSALQERANLRLSGKFPEMLYSATVMTCLKAEIPSEDRPRSEEVISHVQMEHTNSWTVKTVSQVDLIRLFHSIHQPKRISQVQQPNLSKLISSSTVILINRPSKACSLALKTNINSGALTQYSSLWALSYFLLEIVCFFFSILSFGNSPWPILFHKTCPGTVFKSDNCRRQKHAK